MVMPGPPARGGGWGRSAGRASGLAWVPPVQEGRPVIRRFPTRKVPISAPRGGSVAADARPRRRTGRRGYSPDRRRGFAAAAVIAVVLLRTSTATDRA